jgi:hypothetical protein
MDYLPQLQAIRFPYGSLTFPTAAEVAERRAARVLPRLISPVADVETIRKGQTVPTQTVFEDIHEAPSPSLPSPDEPPKPVVSQVPGYTMPDETRAFQRWPTSFEMLDRVQGLQGIDDRTRAALIQWVAGSKFPAERTLPTDVEQARTQEALVEGLLASGRAKTREEAEPIARAMTLAGGRPGAETFLERRLTPQQQETEREAAANEQIRQRRARGELKLDTDADWAAAIEAAEKAGAYDQAQALTRQWRARQMVGQEQRRAAFRETTLPKLQEQVQVFAQHRHFTPEDRAALDAAVAAAEADPTPQKQAALTAAIQGMARQLAARKMSAEREARLTRALDQRDKARAAAEKAGNLNSAIHIGQTTIEGIDRELRRLEAQIQNEFNDVTRRRLQYEQEVLVQRREGIQAWLDEVMGRRAVTPGRDIERPDVRVPPTPQRQPVPAEEPDPLRQGGFIK